MEVEREDQEISGRRSPAARCRDEEPREEPEAESRAGEREEEAGQEPEGSVAPEVTDVEPPASEAGVTPPPPLKEPSEPCWYCLRSLESEFPSPSPQQEDSQPLSLLPSGGQKVTYQTDPRPHFGVACSSHSPCRPLWGSEGPSWGQRAPEESQKTEPCPHCHLGLPADTLRWHEAKCQLFDGTRAQRK